MILGTLHTILLLSYEAIYDDIGYDYDVTSAVSQRGTLQNV